MPKNNVYEEFVRLLLISEEEYEKPEILKFPEIPPIKSLGLEVKNTFFPLLPSCYLAHGSYGSCPSVVLDYYQAYQVLIEKNPTLFYHSKLYPLLAYSIRCLASYLDVNPRRLVLVKNVEVAITTVLKMYPTTICFDISYAAVQYSVSKHSSLEICILSRPITTESIISDFKKFIKELSGNS